MAVELGNKRPQDVLDTDYGSELAANPQASAMYPIYTSTSSRSDVALARLETGDILHGQLKKTRHEYDETQNETGFVGLYQKKMATSCCVCNEEVQNGTLRLSACCGTMGLCRGNACRYSKKAKETLKSLRCKDCNTVLQFGTVKLTVSVPALPVGVAKPVSEPHDQDTPAAAAPADLSEAHSVNSDESTGQLHGLGYLDPPATPTFLAPPNTKGLHSANQQWLKAQYRGWGYAEVGFRFCSMGADTVAFSKNVPLYVKNLFWEILKTIDPNADVTHHSPIPENIATMFASDINTMLMRIVIWEVKPMDDSLSAIGQVLAFCLRVQKELAKRGVFVEVLPGILTYPTALKNGTDKEHLEHLTWTSQWSRVRLLVRTLAGRVTMVVKEGEGAELYQQVVADDMLEECLNPLPVVV